MKILLCLLLFLYIPGTLSAQCDRLIELGQEALDTRNYQLAIERLLDAGSDCPGRQTEIRGLIQQAFAQIEGEKQAATAARQMALREQIRADSSLLIVQAAKARTDSALAFSSRVLEQLFFYEGKFGLTAKNTAKFGPKQIRFGFIDPQGQEVLPFDYLQATPFSPTDGFARVLVPMDLGGRELTPTEALLDTSGQHFRYARTVEELSPELEAFEIPSYFDAALLATQFKKQFKQTPQLKILLHYVSGMDEMENYLTMPEQLTQLHQLEALHIQTDQLSLPSLLDLSHLKILDLKCFGIEGTDGQPFGTRFLQDLSQLSQLTQLTLQWWRQMPPLPEEIGQLHQLQYLNLYDTPLMELPPSFGQLNQLRSLNLGSTQLTALPATFGNLSQLHHANFAYAQLTALPESFGQLAQLQHLDLSNNQLTQLPESFPQLVNLVELDLSGNQLTALPGDLPQLQQLQSLRLSENRLTFPEGRTRLPIPGEENEVAVDEWGEPYVEGAVEAVVETELVDLSNLSVLSQCTTLVYLDLSQNEIQGLPDDIGNLQHLQYLDLSFTYLSAFPESMAQLTQLKELYLYETHIDYRQVEVLQQLLPHCKIIH